MHLGNKLKRMREIRGLTMENLSEISKVPISAISLIETGKRPNPGINTIEKLAEALRVELKYFSRENARTPFDIDEINAEINQQVSDILLDKELMPYILLGRKAYEQQIPHEVITELLETLTKVRNS